MSERRPYTLDRVVRIVLSAIVVIGILYLIKILKGALLPFMVAWLIAYMINPIVVFNQRRVLRTKGRALPILLTFVELLVFFSLIGILVVPSILTETAKMQDLLYNYVHTSEDIPFIPAAVHEFIRENIDFQELAGLLNHEQWMELIKTGISQTWSFISGSVGEIITIVSWLIVVLYTVFILLDYDKILNGFKSMIPQKYRPAALGIADDVEQSMNRYFRGQALVASLVGVLFSIGFLIVGLPLAIVLGLFIGLLNMVPYLQIIGVIPTIILCMICSSDTGTNFWILFGACMLVFIVVQIIQDGFLVPRIMGRVTGLNPAIILLSLSVWGTLLGMIGMIIALPLTTLLLAYYQKYILKEDIPSEKKETDIIENK